MHDLITSVTCANTQVYLHFEHDIIAVLLFTLVAIPLATFCLLKRHHQKILVMSGILKKTQSNYNLVMNNAEPENAKC